MLLIINANINERELFGGGKGENGVNNGIDGFVVVIGPYISNMFTNTTRW